MDEIKSQLLTLLKDEDYSMLNEVDIKEIIKYIKESTSES